MTTGAAIFIIGLWATAFAGSPLARRIVLGVFGIAALAVYLILEGVKLW